MTGTPSIPIACGGAATALSGVASVDEAISHTQAPLPDIAKNTQVRRLTPPPCSGFSRGFRSPYGRAAPHTQAAIHTHQPPSGNSQKTAKSAIPHLAGHALQPMPGCFPHASDPHTDNIPIPPQSDHVPAETSGRLAQIFTPTSPANQLRRRSARRRRQRMTSPRDAAPTSQ